MNQTTMKFLFFCVLGFIFITVILFVINRYVFAWTGLILCEYRTVSVPTHNGQSQPLSFSLDIIQLATEMDAKSEYKLIGRHDRYRADISREFDGIEYLITFESGESSTKFNLRTDNAKDPIERGEKCTTPSIVLKKRIYQMIEDLPLNDTQKDELKKYVRVRNMLNIKLGF